MIFYPLLWAELSSHGLVIFPQMSSLKFENITLQARLEEQTVHTEQLEFELTKLRKGWKQEKTYADQRELQDKKTIADLRGEKTR